MTLRGCASGTELVPATRAMLAASGGMSTAWWSQLPTAATRTRAAMLVAVEMSRARGPGRAGALLLYRAFAGGVLAGVMGDLSDRYDRINALTAIPLGPGPECCMNF